MTAVEVFTVLQDYKQTLQDWVSNRAKIHLDEDERLLKKVKERALAALDEVHRKIDKLTTEDKPIVWLDKILKELEINQVRNLKMWLYFYFIKSLLGLQHGESSKCQRC